MRSFAPLSRAVCALLLLSAGCALHPTPPAELVRGGVPLPLLDSARSDRDGISLYGLTVEDMRRGGMSSEVDGERHVDGLSRFELWREGALQWRVLCPARDSRRARGGMIAACILEPEQGQVPSAVVLRSDMYGALSGVFVSSATVAYALRATYLMDEGVYAHAFTAGVEVRRVGGQRPIAFVNSRAGTAAGGYIANDVPEAERRALAPLLLTLSCLVDPRGGAEYATGGTTRDRPLRPEYRVGDDDFVAGRPPPQALPRTPISAEHRAIIERLVQSGLPAAAEAFQEVIAESEVKDLLLPAPIAGPDLRRSLDRAHVIIELLSLGLRLPNPPRHSAGAFWPVALGAQFFDFVDLYGFFEFPGNSVAGALPQVPIGVVGKFGKVRGISFGFGLRLVALRWRGWALTTGLELGVHKIGQQFDGNGGLGRILVTAFHDGTSLSPLLGLRLDLGRNARGQGLSLVIEGRVDRTDWGEANVQVNTTRSADNALGTASALAESWDAVEPVPSTWSGAIKVALRFQI